MLSLRNVVALVAPIAFVACTAELSEVLFGPAEEIEEGPRQVLCFEGYVVSAVDSRFVPDVSVSLISDNRTLREGITGKDGYYQFQCSPRSYSHTFILRAQKDGWVSQDIEDVHYRPHVQRFNFVLEPLPEE